MPRSIDTPIRFDGVSFSHRSLRAVETHPILENLTYQFSPGLVHILIGRSGCGKTTLLYLIAGLLSPDSGSIHGGFPRSSSSTTMSGAMILQDHGLFPWKTVSENVSLGLQLKGFRKDEVYARACRIMEELSIDHLRASYPHELSGGEQQRAAIARALAVSPDILLMDEPFSSLDAMTRERIQDIFARMARSKQVTAILVTHSIEEAVFLGDVIHVMSRDRTMPGGARIVSIPSPRIDHTPDYRRSTEFFTTCIEVRALLDEEEMR